MVQAEIKDSIKMCTNKSKEEMSKWEDKTEVLKRKKINRSEFNRSAYLNKF